MNQEPSIERPLLRAGLVLGLGFGGFVDGIVLHQILGWHHLICVEAYCRPTSVGQFQIQNRQDGYFHLALWVVSLVGVALLFSAARQTRAAWKGRSFLGAMLAGWGIFNVVEGVIDHHLLGIHHVLPGRSHQLLYDLVFLAAGGLLVLIGMALARTTHFSATISKAADKAH